ISMKRILISFLSPALLCGILLAQDNTPSPSSPTPQEQQTPATTPDTTSSQPQAQQTPEPSTTQPQQAPQQSPAAAGQPAAPQAPANGSAGQAGAPHKIAPGSVIPVQLTKTVDAKKAKTGDEVVAKVTQDLKTTSGEVIVPKDTKVVGHVTQAQARNK